MTTTIKPMKMTDVPVETADNYINDKNWFFEQKMDGARALVHATRAEDQGFSFEWISSGGGALTFAAAKQHFKMLEEELAQVLTLASVEEAWLDGELIVEDGEYRLFDLPYLKHINLSEPMADPTTRYYQRRNILSVLLSFAPATMVVEVPIAKTAEAKQRLWDQANAAGVEGIMAKLTFAPYEPGVRTKHQVKLKFVKTADVIVTGISNWTSTTGSAELSVNIRPEQDPLPWVSEVTGKRISQQDIDLLSNGTKAQMARALAHSFAPRERIVIGNSSLIGKDRGIQVGSVVEINYLYWTGQAVIQPRIMRLRDPQEKRPEDCDLDQFPLYSRVTVGA